MYFTHHYESAAGIRAIAVTAALLAAHCLPAGENIRSCGSGLWSAPATWKGARVPGRADHVAISAGDKVLSESEYAAPMCAGLQVEKDAVLDIRGTFIPAGSVVVAGTLNLLAGAGLQIACVTNAQHGLEVKAGGALAAENSLITSFTRDGLHNAYIIIGEKQGRARGEFIRCELSYLGRPRQPNEHNPPYRDGICFYRNRGAKFVDCRIHHNQRVHFVIAEQVEIRGNQIYANEVGLQLFQFCDFTIAENEIYANQTGITCHVDVRRYANLMEMNRIHDNRIGIWFVSFGKSRLRRNLYWNNRAAIAFGVSPDDLNCYLEHERIYANTRGIDILARSKSARTYALQSCVFGEDPGGKVCANTEADIRLPDRQPGAAKLEILMDNCKFTSADPISNIQAGDRITSMNHNQAPGAEKEWTGEIKQQERE